MTLRLPDNWNEITAVDANRQPLVSRSLFELGGVGQGLPTILSFFQNAALSNEFLEKCDTLGLRDGAFVPVETKIGHPCYDKFAQSMMTLPSNSVLAVVFHGTAEQNVDAIACNGLDPKKRSGQAYGPGEYFATNPQISVGYCKGGTEMFVFLVVVPERTSATRWPENFVVVNNNSHQIPLGTICFNSVDSTILVASKKLREKLNRLALEAQAREMQVEEAKIKAAIMQELMKNDFDEASKLYLENKSALTDLSKKEIAWYVSPILRQGGSLYGTLFPDLPDPLTAAQLGEVTSLEVSERMESRARKNLERTQKLLTKSEEEEKKKASAKAAELVNKAIETEPLTETEKEVAEKMRKSAPPTKKAPGSQAILASILHNISNGRIDVASEVYNEKGHQLDGFSRREIAMSVHRNLEDEELVPVLFPDLPDIMVGVAPPSPKKLKDDHHHDIIDLTQE